MQLTYTLTLEDYKAAQRLCRRQRISWRIKFLFWYFGVPVLAVLGLVFFIAIGRFMHIAATFFGVECGLLYLSLYLPIWRFRRTRKNFERMVKHLEADRSVIIDIDNERIISSMPRVAEGKFFWNAFEAFAQDERMTLLFTAEDRFLFFPTRALSPTQRTELNDLVARNIVRKQK